MCPGISHSKLESPPPPPPKFTGSAMYVYILSLSSGIWFPYASYIVIYLKTVILYETMHGPVKDAREGGIFMLHGFIMLFALLCVLDPGVSPIEW